MVNNRPDFEGGPAQPTTAVEAAALAAGLAYALLPVPSSVQTAEEIARFAALLESLPKPILAFCRTGTRSGKLVRAASEGRRPGRGAAAPSVKRTRGAGPPP